MLIDFSSKRFKQKGLCRNIAIASLLASTPIVNADVFISEFHYDNSGADVGEAIEVSADTATDLSGWSVVLYNGSNGTAYNTVNLSGVVETDSSCGDVAGTTVLNFPSNGIQNGSPDGIALIDDAGVLVEFVSYEGELTATEGPAAGITSVDIGVAESSSTPEGESLQLVEGAWSSSSVSTFGVCTSPVVVGMPSPTPTPTPTPTTSSSVSISEIHYDNEGGDVGEAVELEGPIGTDLSGWSLVRYNGNNGSSYGSTNLSVSLAEVEGCDSGYALIEYPANGLQNGSPDGLALVNAEGELVEFISYEGSMTASGGAADGQESEDIGVSESGSTPVGHSLQKIDGTWNTSSENTFGGCGAESGEPGSEVLEAKVHEVQGSGNEVAITTLVSVEAIVVADYQFSKQLSGFFIQEEDADADSDPQTSEGIFVYCDTCSTDVAVGDLVKIVGLPQDFFDMSQLRATLDTDIEILSSDNILPTPASIALPVSTSALDLDGAQIEIDAFYETVEGMLVSVSNELSAAEYFQLGRYGQVVMSANGRPRQFTDTNTPSVDGYIAHQIALEARTIILDDDKSSQNFALFNDVSVFHPQPGLSVDNFFRGGDTIENLTGVLHYSFSEWRLRPVESFDYSFEPVNPRPEMPEDVGGSLIVASFNVLNYFTTLDESGNLCGPEASFECRGADSAEELLRQTQKIVSAICTIDADIIGLMELENPIWGSTETPISILVNEVNSECGQYAAVETGSVGTDAITVGFIYKPETVELAGTTAILDELSFTDPNNTSVPKNRAAIAQSFTDLKKDTTFTVVVNHLKSKGSSCGAGDDDTTTGQGNCNLTRTLAAQAQAAWIATNPTGADSDMNLIIGDLNAYRNEDPIVALENAGYTDVIDQFNGESAYGFLFDGQLGYLDHALANDALLPYVSGAADWHINADEINLLDYNDTVRDDSEASFEPKPSATELFSPNAYRSSDHDPLLIGLYFPKKLSVDDVLGFYFESLKDGSIEPKGRRWFWRWVNNRVFVSQLYQARYFAEKEISGKACRALYRADSFSDGEKRPRDPIRGMSVEALNSMIIKVSENIGC